MQNEIEELHIKAELIWLPLSTPGKKRFPPNTKFRPGCRFTSDPEKFFSVEVTYSEDQSTETDNQFPATISFINPDREWFQKQMGRSEILLLDAYHVLAVCRNLQLAAIPNK